MARDKDKPDIPLASATRRLLPMALTLGVAAVIGPWLLSAYWLNTFTTVACLILVAGTVALLYGQLGMVSLAQFALTGVGGWVCLRLIHGWQLPFELGLIGGALVAGVCGFLVGLPALRMRGLYLALLTLMVASAFQVLVNVIGFPDGGEGWTGKVVSGQRLLIERPSLATSDEAYFRYTVSWVLLGMVAIEWQRMTGAGRAWALIRKSEAAALSVGIHVLRYKAWAFAFCGLLCGLAGGLIAGLNGQLDNTGFHASQSILLYALTMVGGAYHWMGAVFSGLLMRALPALLNDHGVDGNLSNAFYGFALLVSLIQGRKGIAGALADFYKFVRMSRIVEGTLSWLAIALLLAWTASTPVLAFVRDAVWGDGEGAAIAMGMAGAFFLALVALLFRQAIPAVCWLLLGFCGKRVQDRAEAWEAALSLRLTTLMQRVGAVADHRLLKRVLLWAFNAVFLAWVVGGVFEVPSTFAASLVVLSMGLKAALEVALYPAVLPWRQAIDRRWPKPFASYR